jgi:hypothetical protein
MKRIIATLCLFTALGLLVQAHAAMQLSGAQGRAILEDLNVSRSINVTNATLPANVTNATNASAPADFKTETGSNTSSLWSWGSSKPKVVWPTGEEKVVLDTDPYYGEPANEKTVGDILPPA